MKDKLRQKKWYPYAKGGTYRKWFGNQDYCVNWKHNGIDIRNYSDDKGRIRSHNYNLDYIFRKGITWNTLSSTDTSFRIENHSIFDDKGSSLFMTKDNASKYFYLLGLLNSKLVKTITPIINPTISYQPGTIGSLPFIFRKEPHINDLVENSIDISKDDWDAHETSWDFQRNELLTMDLEVLFENVDWLIDKEYRETGQRVYIEPAGPEPEKLEWCYTTYCQKWERLFDQLHRNEEELNRLFIEIYGLQDELIPDIPLEEITIFMEEFVVI